MNLFCIEHLFTVIACFSLAIFIARYAENTAHRAWALCNCAVGLWSLGSLFAGLSKTPEHAIICWKIAFGCGMFISTFFYHFVCSYFRIKRKLKLILIYLHGIVTFFLFLFYQPLVTVKFLFNSLYYITANPYLNFALTTWWIVTFIAFYEFSKHIKNNQTFSHSSVIMFWAWIIGYSGGTSTFFPTYGIMIYPMYHIFVCLYVGIMTYVIFYHHLLPIDVVIKRSLIYSLLVAIISLTYLLSVLISQKLFSQYLGYSSTIIGSIIIAIAFIPLKNKIQTYVDKIFFKGTQFEIAQENVKLRQELAHTERMKTVAMIASGLAHEIRNPITAIQTFTEYLSQKRNDDKFIDQYTHIVSLEAKRINDLIQELLIFSKPSEPKFEPVDPQLLIQNLIKLLASQISRANIQTNVNLDNSPSYIQADPSQLKQALLNIILNAIDAMPNGGTLAIQTHVIPAKAGIQNHQYIIEISDTGCGIDPKDLTHIFEPFFTKKDKGTGLGLSITQGIIEKHGGKINVKSEIKKGTTFTIKF